MYNVELMLIWQKIEFLEYLIHNATIEVIDLEMHIITLTTLLKLLNDEIIKHQLKKTL